MPSKPHFIIAALPVDEMAFSDLTIQDVFHIDLETARKEIGAMQESLRKAGYTFDMLALSPKTGPQQLLDALEKAGRCDGVIFGYGMRGHPDPKVAIFLEELVALVREHAKDVKILFNWDIPSSLDACKRALGEA